MFKAVVSPPKKPDPISLKTAIDESWKIVLQQDGGAIDAVEEVTPELFEQCKKKAQMAISEQLAPFSQKRDSFNKKIADLEEALRLDVSRGLRAYASTI